MATYKQIQDRVKAESGFVPKTCWIADIKNSFGLTSRIAPNRHSPAARVHSCPADKKSAIEAALRHFAMID